MSLTSNNGVVQKQPKASLFAVIVGLSPGVNNGTQNQPKQPTGAASPTEQDNHTRTRASLA